MLYTQKNNKITQITKYYTDTNNIKEIYQINNNGHKINMEIKYNQNKSVIYAIYNI